SRILIKGGCVLSMDRSVGNHAEADLLVEDGRIREVGPNLRARDAEIVPAGDAIVMPGFVDTHRHAWKTLFRNLGRGGEGEKRVGPAIYGPHYGPDDVYAATLVGLLGALEAGVTTVVDWADILVDRSFLDAVVQAHADSGIRTVLAHAAPAWSEATLVDLSQTRSAEGGNVTHAYGAADPSRFDLDKAASDWAAAREANLRIHAHVGRDESDRGTVAQLAARGLLGEDVTLVHCTNLDAADLDAIASSGTRVSLTPANEMSAGYGAPPLQALIDRDVRPGLGVGNEVEAPGDIFAQMRATNSLQHATLFDLKLSGKAGVPNLLSTREVIKYGTIDGARCAGLAEVTGSLTPGKQADVLVLRTDRPNIAPINDPIGAVVWGMDTSNIDTVLVGGKALVRQGELVADTANVKDLAVAAQRRVASAAGLLVDAGGTR
ncbi:MAG TPA: amidohydrolase family protein, partial [Acidimicrobiia bacterium]